jgi:uncharacterized protein YbjQ (UPF0145 family)
VRAHNQEYLHAQLARRRLHHDDFERGRWIRSDADLRRGSRNRRALSFFGGDITLLAELCERARADAFAAATAHSVAMGGNAMLAVRYDATEIMDGVTEVLCYGTAVRLAPRLRPRDSAT